MNKKGFTLIEVMVSTAILALLAAIIFANVNQGRVKAAEVKVLQENKQVQTAMELYRSDYGSNFPSDSGNISDSLIKSALVPAYISEIPQETLIPGNECKDIKYFSENGVARDFEFVFRCGPSGSADEYIILYPTRSKVPIENAVFANTPTESMAWWLMGEAGSGGTCGKMGIQKTLAENNGNPMIQEDYDELADFFYRGREFGYYQWKCVPSVK